MNRNKGYSRVKQAQVENEIRGLISRNFTDDEIEYELGLQPHVSLVVHEYYEVRFGTYPLAGAYLHLHHFDNRLVMVRSSLPEFRLPTSVPTASDFLPLEALGFSDEEDSKSKARTVIADFDGLASPAWELTRNGANASGTEQILVEAQTGAVLSTKVAIFDLASVYERGPSDGDVVSRYLPDLPGTGYLDGTHFTVYAPGEGDPRVQAPDNLFEYLPHDPADALSFDQVQAYYGATRAFKWFEEKLGYQPESTPIKLRINDTINGRTDNAAYTPPPTGPEVRIGSGSDAITNLARDTDVVSHELGHHLLYPYVSSSTGESGVLHEGTADYFAYAINGDPYLGESVAVGRPYLRTASLDHAWGKLNLAAYRGVEQDFIDFPFVDELGLSSYPYLVFEKPQDIPDDYYSRPLASRSIPIFVTESGWSSQTVDGFTGTPEKQSDYLVRHHYDHQEYQF